MKSNTEKVLVVLKIIAWVALIGYIVQFSGQLISIIIFALDQGSPTEVYGTDLNLQELQKQSTKGFFAVISFVIALSAMNAYVWYWVIHLLSSFNLQNPFSRRVAGILEQTGLLLLGIWVVSLIGNQVSHQVMKDTGLHIGRIGVRSEYLFIAGIVYIVSQVFKRGIELQEENELTV